MDQLATDSNFGNCVDLFAPSDLVGIAHSDADNDFRTGLGTSFAAPHVAGTVAMFLEQNPNVTPAQVAAAVAAGASPSMTRNLKNSTNKLVYSRFSEGATGFAEVYGATDFSNANGWDSTSRRWQTVRLADIDGNGDGKAYVCGHSGEGIVCKISSGTAFTFPTVWTNTFNDVSGYKNVVYTQTFHFAKINNDTKTDFCMRCSNTFGYFAAK